MQFIARPRRCGLFAFVLGSDDPAASARVVDALELFGIGYSWGGYESLMLPINPERTRSAVARAESRPEALTLLLMSPEFQRR